MIHDSLLHQAENNEDTQRHLQENVDKFENSCEFLLKLMKRGERLSGKTVMTKYEIHDRRLRDLFIAGKCERTWVIKPNGKRSHVEYFITQPSIPTKTKVIDMWDKILSNKITSTEQNLFP